MVSEPEGMRGIIPLVGQQQSFAVLYINESLLDPHIS
jgi:hypothetical protein